MLLLTSRHLLTINRTMREEGSGCAVSMLLLLLVLRTQSYAKAESRGGMSSDAT